MQRLPEKGAAGLFSAKIPFLVNREGENPPEKSIVAFLYSDGSYEASLEMTPPLQCY